MDEAPSHPVAPATPTKEFPVKIRLTPVFASLALLTSALLYAPAPALGQATIGWINLDGPIANKPEPFAWLTGSVGPTMPDVIGALDAAAARDDLDAVMIRLSEPALTMSQVEEIGRAITRVRDAGKKVHLFTEIMGPGEVVLGSYCNEVIMQTGGALSLPGLHMEEMYLADSLAWLGLKMDYVQIGKYKGAEERLGNNAPSEAWTQNISQLLDSLYAAQREQIKTGRGLTDRELDNAMQSAWFVSGEQAIKLGLLDAELDRLDLPDHLKKTYGGPITYRTDLLKNTTDGLGKDALSNPFGIFEALASRPENTPTRSTIAIVDIDGAITDGKSKNAGPLGAATVGSLTIRKALKKIEENSLIKGVVVRIDSPGGSAIASESIWQGLSRVATTKPVWVSVGSMAASGGYYIAVAGDKIYLDPSSIVGSIGVVGGKLVRGGAYQKLKINVVPHDRGPAASLMSTLEPFTTAQRALVRDRMTETYNLFVSRVRAGRDGIDIDTTAEGRLFAGKKAIAKGLADTIGGLHDAIHHLAQQVGLADGSYDVMRYPGPKTIEEMLQGMLGGVGISAPGVHAMTTAPGDLGVAAAAIRALVGPRAWPALRDALAAMWTLRNEPVVLTAPRILLHLQR